MPCFLLASVALHFAAALLLSARVGEPVSAPPAPVPIAWLRLADPEPAAAPVLPAPPASETPARSEPRPHPAAPAPEALPAPAPEVDSAPDPRARASAQESVSAPEVAAAPPPVYAPLDTLEVLERSTPRYPRAARRRGVEGVALLRVRVEDSGRVAAVEIERSAGDEDLDRAAARAIRAWRFAPLRVPRAGTGLWVLIPVEFRLR